MLAATPRLRIEPLAELVVFKLYEAHLRDELPDALTTSEIIIQFGRPIPSRLIVTSIDLIRERARSDRQEPLIRRFGKSGSYTYSISSAGVIWVEQQLANGGSPVAYFASQGDDALEDVAGFNSIFISETDSVVSTEWQPLVLDRQSKEFQKTEVDLSRTIEFIRGDNGFASSYPKEREGLLASLTQGLALLREGSPSTRQILDAIIRPLTWIATQFAKTMIGTAAAETAKRVTQFLISHL